jgi:hypothetical protein
MRRKFIYRIAGLAALGSICIIIGGCTAVMFTIGAISDSNSAKEKTIPGYQIGSLKPGVRACVFIHEEDSLKGKYLGLAELTPSEYKQLYRDSKAMNSKTELLPNIEDKITVYTGLGSVDKVIFQGFGYQYHKKQFIAQNQDGFQSYFLNFSHPKRDTQAQLPLSKINLVIDQNGDTLKGSLIRALLISGQIPTNNPVKFETDSLITSFQVAKIDSVRVNKRNNSKWVMGALGMVFDAIFVTIIVRSFNEPWNVFGNPQ